MKQHLKILLLTSLVTLLPLPVGLALWHRLPSRLPLHWNHAGEIDGWGDKALVILALPLILLAVQWLCVFATLSDPRKANHESKIRHIAFWITPLLSVTIYTVTYAVALGQPIKIQTILSLFLGLLFVIIGNYLPKCRQNYTIGIKLPWTFHSEENWRRTHRFAGPLWVVCGLAIIPLGCFGPWFLILIPLSVMSLLPILYSFLLYRKGI